MDRRTGPNQFAPSSQRIEIKKKKNIFFWRGCGEGCWAGWMDGQTSRPKPICLFNFFEIGGITMH